MNLSNNMPDNLRSIVEVESAVGGLMVSCFTEYFILLTGLEVCAWMPMDQCDETMKSRATLLI